MSGEMDVVVRYERLGEYEVLEIVFGVEPVSVMMSVPLSRYLEDEQFYIDILNRAKRTGRNVELLIKDD
jgi:hypothetical protein